MTCRIPIKELTRFITESMASINVLPHHAQALSNVLIEADQRGHYSHGLQRLPMYYKEVQTGTVNIKNQLPEIINESPSSYYLDGKNLIGVVSAEYAMNLAIKKCENGSGISMVSMKNSNHFGIAGHYGLMAVEKNMIGLAFTNTSPQTVPTRGAEKKLGTNPIAFFASKENFQLDMATSAVAMGKIEMKKRLNEKVPKGWMVDEKGQVVEDPKLGNGLLGLGGLEETSGYKGFGLGAMVDILCGVLTGANYLNNVRRWQDNISEPANLGQTFICINPQFFSQDYQQDLQKFSDNLRKTKKIEGSDSKSVILPGDRANSHILENKDSVEYQRQVIDQIHVQLNHIEPMRFV